MKRLVLLLSVVSVFSVVSLHAADRVALVIGNEAYQHARRLNTAVDDAKAVGQSLTALGFDVVPLLNAGVEDLLESFATLADRARGAEAVVVYYAGHGIESGGVNYLIPVDAELEREVQLRTQTVSLDTVLEELKKMSVPARMVILDCCRDNPIQGRSWLATRSAGSGLAALSQDTLAEATLVVYSASPGKPALDRVANTDAHSPFTAALLEELPRPGLHSFEMFGQVEDAVIEKTGGRQAPRLFYNGSTQPFRNFRFGHEAPPASVPPAAPTPTPAPAVVQMPPSTPATPPVVQQTPPAPSLPTLPESGFYDLDALFLAGPYAAYNSYSRSQILKQAQTKLKAAGLYSSTADGTPGPGTQRAVLAWQQAHNLSLTGKLDTATVESL
ncbi:MAG: caspase family protein, partial [Verrucomicrobiales bacterium]|nr:caspase family protein [Verrucomicrobiales bacterium]